MKPWPLDGLFFVIYAVGSVLAETPTSGNDIDTSGENNSTIKDTKMLFYVDLPRHASDTPPFLLIVSPTPPIQSVDAYVRTYVRSVNHSLYSFTRRIRISRLTTTPGSTTPTLYEQYLSDVVHKLHETFIALAAQLHEIHEAVKVKPALIS
ncbi:unnamed protein product [Porites lobata]|uniref:Uncharacterized protein n=1 Tax=Porites lobata TaxID=104759 RepID=A0ABN8NZB4_9CNID|nr:unnamed protein product [Porites lobata]